MKDQELFAFWRHDMYPYVLGVTVVKILEDGKVQTKEYGNGYVFKPLLILPLKEGKELRQKLGELEAGYRKAQDDLRKKWFAKALELTPIVKG